MISNGSYRVSVGRVASSCKLNCLAEMWNYHLPYLYSYVSLFGVLLLLTCTPIGFATIFTEISDYVRQPMVSFYSGQSNWSVHSDNAISTPIYWWRNWKRKASKSDCMMVSFWCVCVEHKIFFLVFSKSTN
jgi:hypothetical protein